MGVKLNLFLSGLMAANLTPSVRISVTGGESESTTDDRGIRIKNRQQVGPAAVNTTAESASTKKEKDTKEKERKDGNSTVVVTNPMSVSVPNLTAGNNTIETTGTAGLLETFAAMARRRTLGMQGLY